MLPRTTSIWQRDSQPNASGKPGAVHMGWWAALDEQLGKCRQHILMVEPARNHQCQVFPAGLVDNGQDAELAPVVGPPLDEVVCPYMPRILRSQPDARTVVQPQPPAFRLLLRNLQSFAPPDPLHTLVV